MANRDTTKKENDPNTGWKWKRLKRTEKGKRKKFRKDLEKRIWCKNYKVSGFSCEKNVNPKAQ
jgi:hypothetical protein